MSSAETRFLSCVPSARPDNNGRSLRPDKTVVGWCLQGTLEVKFDHDLQLSW
jgi:hypothetical protein